MYRSRSDTFAATDLKNDAIFVRPVFALSAAVPVRARATLNQGLAFPS